MAAVGTVAYPARGAFQTCPESYSSYSSRPSRPSFSSADSQSYHSSYSAPTSSLRQYQMSPSHSPRTSRPSTSGDDSRPSLPSISNLLGIADRDRTSHRPSTHQPSVTSHPSHSLPAPASAKPDSAYDLTSRSFTSSYDQRSILSDNLPPTPPRSEAAYGAGTSPGTLSTASSFTQSSIGAQPSRLDTNLSRTTALPPTSYGPSPSSSPRYTTSSSTGASTAAYYSTVAPSYSAAPAPPPPSAYGQRPLPTNFPPPPPAPHALPQPAMHGPSAHNPWEHHHYISPSSQATFPQTQDRYICQACSKAFSRPSSLKIHSHSHTGEKPFKCPHAGCDKAFSVRSNMKRHERGCHAGMAAMASAVRMR